ncbi:hypothetical protein [Arthrobacter sp. FW306-04-A]|uniref:hypothetical protein n=1 Tax=Arthrobacter sp. FW306-04-A TaxID=2879619 RepID=UPI0037C0A92E|nr:hypothetical protein LFT43_03245 [Arthrobacter sp. FW306-04-A]
MKSRTLRAAGSAVVGIALLTGSMGCSGPKGAEATASASIPDDQNTSAAVAKSIQLFFAASTSDQIGAAFPDKATDDTFTLVLDKMDLSGQANLAKKAVTDLALLRVSDPKAVLALAVEDSKVQINGMKATVAVSALSVTSGGTKVSNNDILAADMNNLIFRNGAWVMTYPVSSESSSPTGSTPAK